MTDFSQHIQKYGEGSVVYRNKTTYFYDSEGKEHRDDGPAVVWDNGHKEWYRHGKLYRGGNARAIELPKVTEEDFSFTSKLYFLSDRTMYLPPVDSLEEWTEDRDWRGRPV